MEKAMCVAMMKAMQSLTSLGMMPCQSLTDGQRVYKYIMKIKKLIFLTVLAASMHIL